MIGGLLGIFNNYGSYRKWRRTNSPWETFCRDVCNDWWSWMPKAGKHREVGPAYRLKSLRRQYRESSLPWSVSQTRGKFLTKAIALNSIWGFNWYWCWGRCTANRDSRKDCQKGHVAQECFIFKKKQFMNHLKNWSSRFWIIATRQSS